MIRNGMTRRGERAVTSIEGGEQTAGSHHAAIHSILQNRRRSSSAGSSGGGSCSKLLGRVRHTMEHTRQGSQSPARSGSGSKSPARTTIKIVDAPTGPHIVEDKQRIDAGACGAPMARSHLTASGMTASNLTVSNLTAYGEQQEGHDSYGSRSSKGSSHGSSKSRGSHRSSSTPPSGKIGTSDTDRTETTVGMLSHSDRTGTVDSSLRSSGGRAVEEKYDLRVVEEKYDLHVSGRSGNNVDTNMERVVEGNDFHVSGPLDGSGRSGNNVDGSGRSGTGDSSARSSWDEYEIVSSPSEESGRSGNTAERNVEEKHGLHASPLDGSGRSGTNVDSSGRSGTVDTSIRSSESSVPSRAEMIAAALSSDRHKRSLSKDSRSQRSKSGSRTGIPSKKQQSKRGRSQPAKPTRYNDEEDDDDFHEIQKAAAHGRSLSPSYMRHGDLPLPPYENRARDMSYPDYHGLAEGQDFGGEDFRTSLHRARENSRKLSMSSQGSSYLSHSTSSQSQSSGSVKMKIVGQEVGESNLLPPAEETSMGASHSSSAMSGHHSSKTILRDNSGSHHSLARGPTHETHPMSDASLLSHGTMQKLKSRQQDQAASPKKGKAKKLWKAVRGGFKKGKTKDGTKAERPRLGAIAETGGLRHVPPSSTKSSTPPSALKRPPSAQQTPDLSWDDDRYHALRDSTAPSDAPGHDDEEDVLPWEPTVSMLMQTGQLDAIESCSEEDEESSNRNMNYHGSAHNSSKGHDVDDFIEEEKSGDDGTDNSMNKFFDHVAHSYMDQVRDMNMEITCDGASRADESTLSKGESTLDSAGQRLAGRGASAGSEVMRQEERSNAVQPKKKKRSRSLGIRTISETFSRRGRSRGRRKKQANPAEEGEGSGTQTGSGGVASNQRSKSAFVKKGTLGSASLASSNQHSKTSRTDTTLSSTSSRRSRSLFRRTRDNVSGLLRRSISKDNAPEPHHDVEPPRRGSSFDRIYDSRGSKEKYRRDAASVPRNVSHTPSTRKEMTDSEDSLAKSLENVGYAGGMHRSRASVGSSDSSSRGRSQSRRREKCIICHSKIPRGEGIHYMDFYFCCGDEGTCFQCGTCRKLLGAEPEGCSAQMISNTRGSIIQCSACSRQTMPIAPVPPHLRSSNTVPAHLRSSNTSNMGYSESSCLRQSLNLFESDSEFFPDRDQSPETDYQGGDQPRTDLMKAARLLAEKASVRLNLAPEDGRRSANDRLSTLYFMKSEEGVEGMDTAARVGYELDSDAYGNPNYDGYACSMIDLEDGPPRAASVALPKLESDEIDGTIAQELEIDLRWVDDDDDDDSDDDSQISSLYPRRTGPAMLSIEPFKTSTISKESVMKVLRQTWEHEEDGLLYRFAFVVPFKKIYISWEIDEGDELDLTQCQLMAAVRRVAPAIQPHVTVATDEAEATEATQPPANATVHDESDSSMPNAVYVKKVSVDESATISLGHPRARSLSRAPSVVLSRKDSEIDPDRDENDNFSELLSVAGCVDSIIALPTITYVKVEKKEHDCEIGLSLIEKNGATVVAEVSKSGLFANSGIKEGCELLAINGQRVRCPRSVLRLMKDTVGKVFVMVTDSPSPPGCRFVVKAHKSTGFSNTGKGDIRLDMVDGLVRVRAISETGIFANSHLSTDDICLSVDGVPAVTDHVATRALGRSQGIVAMLIFSLPDFWKNIVEFIIDEKYNRWWISDSVCKLLLGTEDCTPITLNFDYHTGRCKADGNEENEIDLRYMNIILDRVLRLLTASIKAYQSKPKERVRSSSRSLSVSPSGKMNNRSDVYRRALIKLDEMRENGTLSVKDYEAGRLALAQVAIQTAT